MLTLFLLSLLVIPPVQTAADPSGARHQDPVPELAPPVAARFGPGGVRVTANGVELTFWWVKELPLKSSGTALAWSDVDEGALVGAVNIARDIRDIRGKIIKGGLYTLRYGIQPANGDHLGVSPFREFLLLSPAAIDKNPAPAGHDGAVDLSKQTIGGSHPAVWSIDPPVASEPPLSVHTTDLGHKSVIMEVPVTRGGKPEGPLRFGVVVIGRIEA